LANKLTTHPEVGGAVAKDSETGRRGLIDLDDEAAVGSASSGSRRHNPAPTRLAAEDLRDAIEIEARSRLRDSRQRAMGPVDYE
jgi:hypothetical protein